MIQIRNISKKYQQVTALSDVTLDLHAGQSIALIGPNGSGKSTLMKCVLGLVHADTGSISVMDQPVLKNGAYRAHIGYMPQIIRFPENMQVRQLFDMMQDIRRHKGATDRELYDAFGIEHMAKKPLGGLSGGMKQKVNAALAFLFDPSIIILDEPTAGLDPLSAEILKEKVRKEKEKGKLIIISSHILADLEEITTEVLFLIDGHVEFFKDLETLKSETQTGNLSKAIARIMSQKKEAYATH